MKRLAVYGLGALLILAGVAFWQRDSIRIWLLVQKIESNTEGERVQAVESLVAMDGVGFAHLLELLTRDEPGLCELVGNTIEGRCETWSAGNPLFDQLAVAILEHYSRFSAGGKHAALCLLPKLLSQGADSLAEKFRPHILAGLLHPEPRIRARAVVLAQRTDVSCLEAIVPLMKDESATVRRAAMLAVGPSPVEGEPLIGTEELLPWLHDSDPLVRRNCEIALSTRGLSSTEIQLSRQITDANPVERLKVLLNLPYDEEFRITPWLDRLSRDRESAVRAGAARVAVERGIDFEDRLIEMIESDPDQSVRKIAEHYRKRK